MQKLEKNDAGSPVTLHESAMVGFNSALFLDCDRSMSPPESEGESDNNLSVEFNEIDCIGSDLLSALDSAGSFEPPKKFKEIKPFKPTIEFRPTIIDKKLDFEHKDGSWDCSDCHNHNFSGRRACNLCKKRKFPDLNWVCSQCDNYNLKDRKKCKICGIAKH